MRLKILDKKKESTATCYLCKVDLIEYIKSIPDSYRDFDVQRGIVSNRYLDHLADTVKNKKHIPPIVLVCEYFKEKDQFLSVDEYRILDGLQRTHRLKIIWELIDFLVLHPDRKTIAGNVTKFIRSNSKEIKEIGGDVKLVKSLVDFGCLNLNTSEAFFEGNSLWIELWTNLDQTSQIDKMLLLNAGHKSVNIKHQLELLFLSTLIKFEEIAPERVEFIREKELSSIQYSKTRKLGQYHSSHLISALIALCAGKIVNTNNDLVSEIQFDQNGYLELVDGFGLQLIKQFVNFLFTLDRLLYESYQDYGIKWIGREVVLIGIFSAIGEYAVDSAQTPASVFAEVEIKLPTIVKSLKLREFETARNEIELNKVNIGSVNKKAVFEAMHDLIRSKKFQGWNRYFGSRA